MIVQNLGLAHAVHSIELVFFPSLGISSSLFTPLFLLVAPQQNSRNND